MMKENNQKKKKSTLVFWVIFIIIIGIIGTAGFYIYQIMNQLDTTSEEGKTIRENYSIDWSGRMNILVIGCDEREHLNLGIRADTLVIANLDLKNKIVRIMSIPRDAWVEIPGHGCYDKINSTLNPYYFSDGGVGLTLKTVENLLNIPVKLYVKTNFDTFKDVVDALGGIVYTVEKDMYYVDPTDPETVINLKKGEQQLDGEKALQYCRFRWDAQGDFVLDYEGNQCGRTARQIKFLKALASKVAQTKNLLTINSIINIVVKDTDTNIDSSEMLKTALLFRNLDINEQLESIAFPGQLGWENHISVIIPQEEQLEEIVQTQFRDPANQNELEDETGTDE